MIRLIMGVSSIVRVAGFLADRTARCTAFKRAQLNHPHLVSVLGHDDIARVQAFGDFDPAFVQALAVQSWSLYGIGMFLILLRV